MFRFNKFIAVLAAITLYLLAGIATADGVHDAGLTDTVYHSGEGIYGNVIVPTFGADYTALEVNKYGNDNPAEAATGLVTTATLLEVGSAALPNAGNITSNVTDNALTFGTTRAEKEVPT